MSSQREPQFYPEWDNKTTQILSVLVITTSLALIAFSLRMYVRILVVKSLGWDDYTIIAATVFAIITLIFESLAVKNGIGTHKMYLSEAGAIEAAKWATLAITPNLLATMMARISLCLLMLRIVGKTQPYRIFLVSVIVLTTAIGTLACINTYITCKPVPKIWNSALPGTCDSDMRHAIGLTLAVWSISSDWLVAFFPLLILKNLQMAIRTKVALAIIMGLGFLIGVLVLVKTLKVGALFSRTDSTYDGADLATWSLVEQNVGIIVVNVPAIRPLFSRVFALDKTSGMVGSRYIERSYKMDDMSWGNKSKGLHSGVITISARQAGDDNGSESSLVAKNYNGGITKTVGVSLHSYQHSRGRGTQEVVIPSRHA